MTTTAARPSPDEVRAALAGDGTTPVTAEQAAWFAHDLSLGLDGSALEPYLELLAGTGPRTLRAAAEYCAERNSDGHSLGWVLAQRRLALAAERAVR